MDDLEKTFRNFFIGLILVLSLTLIILAIVAINTDHGVIINQGNETFVIKAVNPPKHVYVDLEKDGQIYEHIYVSKHFYNWEQIRVGQKITVMTRDIKYRNGTVQKTFLNTKDAIECLIFNEGKNE